jgi:hypothetical protein
MKLNSVYNFALGRCDTVEKKRDTSLTAAVAKLESVELGAAAAGGCSTRYGQLFLSSC